jgi:hypothetical protein
VPSQSLLAAQANLGVVNDILSFHSKEKNPAPGAPMTADASLVLGATALLYAVWEAYTEDLAIELVDVLSKGLTPAKVPTPLRKKIVNGATKWDLAGDGWRSVWRKRVKDYARGTDAPGSFGMNTAGPANVSELFSLIGVLAFHEVSWSNATTKQVKDRLQKLVRDRGDVVHTAKPPYPGYGINQARAHRDFVTRLMPNFDKSIGKSGTAVLGTSVW